MKKTSYSQPTLGVVVPSRNGDKYLAQALASLEKQSEKPDSIVLSNNYSTDGTLELFNQYAERHANVQVVTTDKFIDFGPSFNFAASHSKADWIYFLHSDDILSSQAIRIIKKQISDANHRVGLISFGAEWIDESSELVHAKFGIGLRRTEEGVNFVRRNLGGSSINFGAVVINRRVFQDIGGFDSQNSLWLDLKYYHKLVKTHEILRIPTPIIRYRIYASVRDSDQRVEQEKNNLRYWNSEYLPKLAGEYDFKLPGFDEPQSFLTKLKLYFKRDSWIKLRFNALKLATRLILDRFNLGMFRAK
jgi:glycosyltransferase involved in cell wall biosynthesis